MYAGGREEWGEVHHLALPRPLGWSLRSPSDVIGTVIPRPALSSTLSRRASFNSPAKSLAAVVKLALSLEFRVRVTRRAGHAGARDFAHPPRPQRAAALIGPGVKLL
ncbi:predicted protein [Coccidioides posadasii str. Silveira]|uniref:Predicted protein n=1 Tax=Coccidioides posadasii (strain RMSCC 757 / Silveira) TaxID=443226 RepID=E9DCP5_COCPS|nr:predicted protein [Coccidioides posadasii str. Silveira]